MINVKLIFSNHMKTISTGNMCLDVTVSDFTVSDIASLFLMVVNDGLRVYIIFTNCDHISYLRCLRAMHEGFTGVYVDWVHTGRGNRDLLTCWISLF